MTQYISKAALVADIERRIRSANNDVKIGAIESLIISKTLNGFKSFLDTLEVKEVDLEKEYEEFVVDDPIFGNFITNDTMGMKLAKYFFELGLKVNKSLTWEDIANINEIVSEILKECGDDILYNSEKEFCEEVLKRFKAQKGE